MITNLKNGDGGNDNGGVGGRKGRHWLTGTSPLKCVVFFVSFQEIIPSRTVDSCSSKIA